MVDHVLRQLNTDNKMKLSIKNFPARERKNDLIPISKTYPQPSNSFPIAKL
jgi:hypothetical protein